nr:helicase SRCAP-like [Aegilops tauschii subsp. strangulata]
MSSPTSSPSTAARTPTAPGEDPGPPLSLAPLTCRVHLLSPALRAHAHARQHACPSLASPRLALPLRCSPAAPPRPRRPRPTRGCAPNAQCALRLACAHARSPLMRFPASPMLADPPLTAVASCGCCCSSSTVAPLRPVSSACHQPLLAARRRQPPLALRSAPMRRSCAHAPSLACRRLLLLPLLLPFHSKPNRPIHTGHALLACRVTTAALCCELLCAALICRPSRLASAPPPEVSATSSPTFARAAPPVSSAPDWIGGINPDAAARDHIAEAATAALHVDLPVLLPAGLPPTASPGEDPGPPLSLAPLTCRVHLLSPALRAHAHARQHACPSLASPRLALPLRCSPAAPPRPRRPRPTRGCAPNAQCALRLACAHARSPLMRFPASPMLADPPLTAVASCGCCCSSSTVAPLRPVSSACHQPLLAARRRQPPLALRSAPMRRSCAHAPSLACRRLLLLPLLLPFHSKPNRPIHTGHALLACRVTTAALCCELLCAALICRPSRLASAPPPEVSATSSPTFARAAPTVASTAPPVPPAPALPGPPVLGVRPLGRVLRPRPLAAPDRGIDPDAAARDHVAEAATAALHVDLPVLLPAGLPPHRMSSPTSSPSTAARTPTAPGEDPGPPLSLAPLTCRVHPLSPVLRLAAAAARARPRTPARVPEPRLAALLARSSVAPAPSVPGAWLRP